LRHCGGATPGGIPLFSAFRNARLTIAHLYP
jgi:hypothetical protein